MKPVPAGVLLRGIDTETAAPHVTASTTASIRSDKPLVQTLQNHKGETAQGLLLNKERADVAETLSVAASSAVLASSPQ